MVKTIVNVLTDAALVALCLGFSSLAFATLVGTCRRAIDALRKWRETARHIDAAKRRAWNNGYKCGHKDGRKQGRREATSK